MSYKLAKGLTCQEESSKNEQKTLPPTSVDANQEFAIGSPFHVVSSDGFNFPPSFFRKTPITTIPNETYQLYHTGAEDSFAPIALQNDSEYVETPSRAVAVSPSPLSLMQQNNQKSNIHGKNVDW